DPPDTVGDPGDKVGVSHRGGLVEQVQQCLERQLVLPDSALRQCTTEARVDEAHAVECRLGELLSLVEVDDRAGEVSAPVLTVAQVDQAIKQSDLVALLSR